MFEQYFSLSAQHTINVDGKVAKDIEINLSEPTRHIFDEAQKEVSKP
jgi:hypothetical protein